ncbi:hypothetical protein [Brevundimonas nasdae]|uniref:Uncharacterized protein n=2 Tax=Bacteria TaxID=2 RepID=A0ABX8TD49_9CAUL|nr:hypothetical protein [Brevundimonas nasdae]QYC09096.1 hypothetical protein KWG56_10675 [Brevundimonas nasdae]QYC15146.1 hypothetical protein KWG63_06010 [Brevundimonas nasdae]
MAISHEERALDTGERELVAQSRDLGALNQAQLTDLQKRLRARRDRVQRMIRTRTRNTEAPGPDTGARQKKALLAEAVKRVTDEVHARRDAARKSPAEKATRNLAAAVQHKSENPGWRGPEDLTANTGPAETPNTKIAPSGALHAEGMRAVIARSTGDR